MDDDLRQQLDSLYDEGRGFDATQPDRLTRRRNLEPVTAQLLGVLVRSARATRILEVGTSNGFSTVWLAAAARATGGRVTSLDVDAERTAAARANLERAHLDGLVDLRTEDAGEYLARESGPWDVVFLDAERQTYPDYWPDLITKLRPDGGLIVVDNAISHADELVAFRALVEADPRVTWSLVNVGAGALLIVREPDDAVHT